MQPLPWRCMSTWAITFTTASRASSPSMPIRLSGMAMRCRLHHNPKNK